MDTWTGKVAVVTGASAGIGAAIALELANNGMHVVGLARRKERVEELAEQVISSTGRIYAYQCDVACIDSIVAAFRWVDRRFGKVHVLVNNAGRTKAGTTLDPRLPHQEILDTINVNLSGLVICTREAYKLIERHDDLAYIININSVLGHISSHPAYSTNNVYSATKHAVTVHTEQIRLDIANSPDADRIRVTVRA